MGFFPSFPRSFPAIPDPFLMVFHGLPMLFPPFSPARPTYVACPGAAPGRWVGGVRPGLRDGEDLGGEAGAMGIFCGIFEWDLFFLENPHGKMMVKWDLDDFRWEIHELTGGIWMEWVFHDGSWWFIVINIDMDSGSMAIFGDFHVNNNGNPDEWMMLGCWLLFSWGIPWRGRLGTLGVTPQGQLWWPISGEMLRKR